MFPLLISFRATAARRLHRLPPASAAGVCTVIIGAALLFSAPELVAHGDVHEGIVLTTAEIEKSPKNADLYLRRGGLYRVHRDFAEALADFRKAAELAPDTSGALLAAGEVLIELGRYAEAEETLRAVDRARPSDSHCWAALGRLHMERRELEAAAAAFGKAVQYSKPPEPHLVLLHSRALQAAGKIPEAIASLDDGVKALGALPVFIEPAVELESSQKNWEGALARIDIALKSAPRKERWLARKATVLESAGRKAEALKTLKLALAELDSLPAGRRTVPMMKQFEDDLRERIGGLSGETEKR